MLEDFNLLIATRKGDEDAACSEAWYLLGKVGDAEAAVDRTPVAGLVVARTRLNPFEAVEALRRLFREHPEEFNHTLKFTPVERVVRTGLEEIREAARALAGKISEVEKFRVTVEKRHTELGSRDIIEAAASAVKGKVDLKSPDKILLVEVLGRLTGLSVVKPGDILSITKERQPPG